MWCLFKKPKYSSTRLESLGYLPQLDVVQNFWKLCEQQLNIPGFDVTQILYFIRCIAYKNKFLNKTSSSCWCYSFNWSWSCSSTDEIEDEDANEEYIEDTNKDVVMIAAAKLVLADTVSKVSATFSNCNELLGPQAMFSYYIFCCTIIWSPWQLPIVRQTKFSILFLCAGLPGPRACFSLCIPWNKYYRDNQTSNHLASEKCWQQHGCLIFRGTEKGRYFVPPSNAHNYYLL